VNAIQAVWNWLDQVVIGLNLCPFAAKPRRQNQIYVTEFPGTELSQLDQFLLEQLDALNELSAEERETSLIVIPNLLQKFDDYLDYLDQAQFLLERAGLEGIIQIASFHPDYCFAGSQPTDVENLTNRAPYAILHLIREDSLSHVLARYPNPERIPEINMETMKSLTSAQRLTLFPYLYKT